MTCYVSEDMVAGKMAKKLVYWRAERPDEWTMDEFIKDAEQLQKENDELKARMADIQRLCERAYLTITDNYAEYTDGEGLGPTSLINDLEKVMNGKECRDLRASNSALANALKDRISKVDELSAYVERLRRVIIDATNNGAQLDSGAWAYSIDDSVLSETPSQSLNHIRAQVEEETIERCIRTVMYAADAYLIKNITRKYKEQSNED